MFQRGNAEINAGHVPLPGDRGPAPGKTALLTEYFARASAPRFHMNSCKCDSAEFASGVTAVHESRESEMRYLN